MFDGHRLVTSTKIMPFAELGDDSKRLYMPQINPRYIYSLGKERGLPVYYKQFVGSTPNVSTFSSLLKESGIDNSDCTTLAEKGFVRDGFRSVAWVQLEVCACNPSRQSFCQISPASQSTPL